MIMGGRRSVWGFWRKKSSTSDTYSVIEGGYEARRFLFRGTVGFSTEVNGLGAELFGVPELSGPELLIMDKAGVGGEEGRDEISSSFFFLQGHLLLLCAASTATAFSVDMSEMVLLISAIMERRPLMVH